MERFYRKLEARQQHVTENEELVPQTVTADVELLELGLSKRALTALSDANISNAEDVIARLNEGGEESLLSISGFGRKSLIDLKKALRALGIEFSGQSEDQD